MEKTALENYSTLTGNKVIESGLIVKPNQTWLCSSPDGLIKDHKICLEIKCPSSCENIDISVDYIRYNNLVKSHPYFTQVQLQMYTSNSDSCHFFVFSEKDFILINVPRDNEFLQEVIPKLEKIYFTEIFPALMKKYTQFQKLFPYGFNNLF